MVPPRLRGEPAGVQQVLLPEPRLSGADHRRVLPVGGSQENRLPGLQEAVLLSVFAPVGRAAAPQMRPGNICRGEEEVDVVSRVQELRGAHRRLQERVLQVSTTGLARVSFKCSLKNIIKKKKKHP